jgi:hypothetical protein
MPRDKTGRPGRPANPAANLDELLEALADRTTGAAASGGCDQAVCVAAQHLAPISVNDATPEMAGRSSKSLWPLIRQLHQERFGTGG